MSIIVPITLPKDCRRSTRKTQKHRAKIREPFSSKVLSARSFCMNYYISIYESCQLFFHFFLLLIYGRSGTLFCVIFVGFPLQDHKILWFARSFDQLVGERPTARAGIRRHEGTQLRKIFVGKEKFFCDRVRPVRRVIPIPPEVIHIWG